jgi:hypothetical protein
MSRFDDNDARAMQDTVGRYGSCISRPAGRIRRGEPELSGMASSPPAGRTRPVASLPISQTGCPLDESGSRLRPAAAGLWRAKGCLSYGNL